MANSFLQALYNQTEDHDETTALPIENIPRSFFIIGAPRCATTSLSRVLRKHPDINFSKPKETHFFLHSDQITSDRKMRNAYLSRFHSKLKECHLAIGDGSVSHLYSDEAFKQILRFDPEARFIVLARNPTDLVLSYHRRLIYTLDEDVRDFSVAWGLQSARAAGKSLPKKCRDPRLLRYAEVGKVGQRIQSLLEVVPRHQVLIVLFDEFTEAPLSTYKKVLDFIGVAYDGRTDFPIYAQGTEFRSRPLQALVMNPPAWIFKIVNVNNASLRQRLKPLRRRLMSRNVKHAPKRRVSDQLRKTLSDYFRDDVSIIQELTGADLGHWT